MSASTHRRSFFSSGAAVRITIRWMSAPVRRSRKRSGSGVGLNEPLSRPPARQDRTEAHQRHGFAAT